MNQFYAPAEQITSSEFILKGQEAKHAAKVLRKSAGEKIFVTDGRGNRYTGRIESAGKNELRASIIERTQFKKPKREIELCLGLIRKRDRLEFAIEKATELGVSQIHLFRADHSEPFKVRLNRAEAAVESAMKQSLRVFLPQIMLYNSLDELLETDMDRVTLIQADPEGEYEVNTNQTEDKRILLIVGPEGGLSDRESDLLKSKKATKLSLGDYRLRAETAAVIISSKFGNKKADRVGSA